MEIKKRQNNDNLSAVSIKNFIFEFNDAQMIKDAEKNQVKQ